MTYNSRKDVTIEKIMNLKNNGYTTKMIAEHFNCSVALIGKRASQSGVRFGRSSVSRRNYFKAIDSEEKAYWLGFMYADGYITDGDRVGVTLSIQDIKHLEKFKECIESSNEARIYEPSRKTYGGAYCRLRFRCREMYADLKSKGVHENKSQIISFPTEDILPVELRRHFIRGYVDGDGNYSYGVQSNGKPYYKISILGTKEFLTELQSIFDIEVKLDKRRDDDTNNYNLQFGGRKQFERVINYLYQDCNMYLDRKFEKVERFIN